MSVYFFINLRHVPLSFILESLSLHPCVMLNVAILSDVELCLVLKVSEVQVSCHKDSRYQPPNKQPFPSRRNSFSYLKLVDAIALCKGSSAYTVAPESEVPPLNFNCLPFSFSDLRMFQNVI